MLENKPEFIINKPYMEWDGPWQNDQIITINNNKTDLDIKKSQTNYDMI